MRARVERKAPDTVYLVVPLCLALCAVIAYIIGSTQEAVWMALLAYSTSAFGSLVKVEDAKEVATAGLETQLAGLKSVLERAHGERDSKVAQAPAARIAG